MKEFLLAALGAAGGFIASAFGGWDKGIVVLMLFMAVDYLSGLVVAAVFKRSTKTDTGTLNSSVGWRGLVKKFMCLVLVLVGHQLDVMLGMAFVRSAVIIAFSGNELISITENMGLMGIPIPKAILNAIDVIQKKSGTETENGTTPKIKEEKS